jgi:hypothetical protein
VWGFVSAIRSAKGAGGGRHGLGLLLHGRRLRAGNLQVRVLSRQFENKGARVAEPGAAELESGAAVNSRGSTEKW